jgi:CRP/FNR family transcriptional regulator
MQSRDILARQAFWHEASPAFRAEIERTVRPAALAAGEWYFQEGGPCRSVALVGRGSVRVFKRSENGREITLYHVDPGQSCLLTLQCAMNETDYPGSGVVDRDVEALLVPVETFRAWVEREPCMRRFVLGAMSHRLVELMTLVEEVAFQSVDHRLARYLCERFADADTLETTHAAIAAELGTAREVVSRLLRDMERAGALATGRGRLRLRDPGVLSRMAGDPH